MPISAAGKERALRHIFGGNLWLGLATRIEGDSLIELADEAYERQKIRFSAPELEGEAAEIRSAERIAFPPYARDLPRAPALWFVSDAKKGGAVLAHGELEPRFIDPDSGEVYARREVSERARVLGAAWGKSLIAIVPRASAGEEPIFPAGAIRIQMSDDEEER